MGVAGGSDDSVSVQRVSSTFCAQYGHDQLRIVDQLGTSIQSLSCSNNAYSLSTRFSCSRCANGFVADASVPSGCTVLRVPSRPPTPPPPEIAAPPASPPPTHSLPGCLTKITRKLLETPSISSSCSSSNVQVGVGGSAGSCSRAWTLLWVLGRHSVPNSKRCFRVSSNVRSIRRRSSLCGPHAAISR